MSDIGSTARDVLLRVRVENLSTAGFAQVRSEVDKLTASLESQIAAANKGLISERELAASITKLEQAARNLTGIATLIDKFKDFDRVLTTAEANVEKARQKLADFRTSLDSTGDTSAKAERQLAQLVRGYERQQAILASQKQAYADLSQRLQQAGVDTANLATAEQNLNAVAAQTGQALTQLNRAKLDYAQNSRLAKEAAAAERAEREKAIATTRAEAAAKLQANEALRSEISQRLVDFNKRVETNQAIVAAERARYDSMLASTRKFNEETRALTRQRAAEETAQLRATLAETMAINRQKQAGLAGYQAGAVSNLTPQRGPTSVNAQAAGLFGLRPYELQNLSYQINDIISGFASGQRASQIFAQQGGQVLQLFGKNLFTLIPYFPLVAAGIAAITVVVGGLTRAFRELESSREFNATLGLNVDGTIYSTKLLNNLRKEIRDLGIDWKEAGALLKEGIAAGLRPEVLGDFAKAARDMSDVTGKKVPESMNDLVIAFTHGFDAIKKLDTEQNFLTADQYKLIRSLFDSGKGAEAQALAFDIYKKKISDAQKDAVSPFTEAMRKLSAAWDSFLVTVGNSSFISTLVGALTGLVNLIDRTVTGLDNLIEKAKSSKLPLTEQQKAAIEPVQKAADVVDQGLLVAGAKAVYDWLTRAAQPVASSALPPPIPGGERFSLTNGVKLDNETLRQLAQIIGEASKSLPPGYRVEAISAERPGARTTTGTVSEHARGIALDVRIVDSQGQPVPSLMGTGQAVYDPIFRAFDQTVKDIATRVAPGTPLALGGKFGRSDAGHYSLGGQEAANQAAKEGADAAQVQQQNTQRTLKQLEDVNKAVADLKDKDATANEAAQRRLDLESALVDAKAKGYDDDAANRLANAIADQKALERQRERSAQARQDQIRSVQAGAEEERVRAAGAAARQAEEAKGNQNIADLRRVQLDAENLERAKIQQKEKEISELRTLDNQLAALARQNELKNVNDIEARVRAVANQYTAILNTLAKFQKDFPNVDIGDRVKKIESQRDEATQLARAQGYLDKLNALQADRNALVSTYNTLVEKGAITISEQEGKIAEAFARTAPEINKTTEEFAKFLETADKIDPTKLDLYNAKIKELRANATYISPLFKTIKDAAESSFSTGLSTAFNTISEAIGGLIAKTKSWKDVLDAVKTAALNFFAQLLKDIATAIIKYEALKIASSLFGGGSGGGGILGSLFGGVGNAASSAATATATTTSQTGLFGLGFLGLHQGGVVGQVAPKGTAPASWWAGAPRYHDGRSVIGLAPNEEAAILQRGEEVLSADNPRNIMNRGAGGAINIRNVLVDDRSRIPEAMTGAHGERVVIQHLVNNAATVRELVRG